MQNTKYIAQLIQGAKSGNRKALKLLFDAYALEMLTLSQRITGNRQDAKITAVQQSLNIYQFSSASIFTPSTTIVGYRWDFGDGNTSTAASPTHTYTATGFYPVTLKLYGLNNNGDCCEDEVLQYIFVGGLKDKKVLSTEADQFNKVNKEGPKIIIQR